MAPRLYMLMACPSVRAVLMTADQLGVELEKKIISLVGNEQFSEEFLKMNPAHTVPTLDDDGFILFEGGAIMSYLVSKYKTKDSLYPQDIKKRATIDKLLHFWTQSFTMFIATTRSIILSTEKKASVTQESKDKIFEKVEILDKLIGDNKYVAGDDLTIADFGFVTYLSTLNVAFPIPLEKYPNISRWWKEQEKLRCYRINVEGVEMFKQIWAHRE